MATQRPSTRQCPTTPACLQIACPASTTAIGANGWKIFLQQSIALTGQTGVLEISWSFASLMVDIVTLKTVVRIAPGTALPKDTAMRAQSSVHHAGVPFSIP